MTSCVDDTWEGGMRVGECQGNVSRYDKLVLLEEAEAECRPFR